MNKKILFLLVGLIVVLGVGYFASLHVSREKPKTETDVRLQNVLEQQSTDSEVATQNEDLAPDIETIKEGAFNPDATGSDALHRGWGGVSIVHFERERRVVMADDFKVTNGPDYMVYLVRGAVPETEEAFQQSKDQYDNLGRMTQFSGFQTFDIPENVDVSSVSGVVVWCERFSEFISSAALSDVQ